MSRLLKLLAETHWCNKIKNDYMYHSYRTRQEKYNTIRYLQFLEYEYNPNNSLR